VHPEYVFRTFKGGAWLFTWDALVRADGYAHVYWGWGLEDDDLGARALAANLSVATRPFPVSTKNVSSASRRDVSLKASRDQCTGFARACAFDPTRTDCLADVPYDSFKKRAFAKTPRTTREGLIVPEGRTLADGVCFAHAHEGTFSRDALETNARRHPRLSPEFTRGRRWEDVRSGRFRADETTGLARLTPARSRRRGSRRERVSDFPRKKPAEKRAAFSGETRRPIPATGSPFSASTWWAWKCDAGWRASRTKPGIRTRRWRQKLWTTRCRTIGGAGTRFWNAPGKRRSKTRVVFRAIRDARFVLPSFKRACA